MPLRTADQIEFMHTPVALATSAGTANIMPGPAEFRVPFDCYANVILTVGVAGGGGGPCTFKLLNDTQSNDATRTSPSITSAELAFGSTWRRPQ